MSSRAATNSRHISSPWQTSEQKITDRKKQKVFLPRLEREKKDANVASCRFRDACGLQFLLTTQMQDLTKSQKTVQDAVKSLEGPASQAVIDEVTICHLRPMRLPLNK